VSAGQKAIAGEYIEKPAGKNLVQKGWQNGCNLFRVPDKHKERQNFLPMLCLWPLVVQQARP
jgi:hypothetical protein